MSSIEAVAPGPLLLVQELLQPLMHKARANNKVLQDSLCQSINCLDNLRALQTKLWLRIGMEELMWKPVIQGDVYHLVFELGEWLDGRVWPSGDELEVLRLVDFIEHVTGRILDPLSTF